MSTIVFFHAHPDDEAIFTGGTMLRLRARGHRVVLVVATGGELGLRPSELSGCLGTLRRQETERAAALLGVHRLEFLGYLDSGMAGDDANHRRGSFVAADPALAAAALARILAEERAEAVVVYDEGGVYGHPDHVRVHEVGVLAAELAGVETVYEATIDGEYLHFVEEHLIDSARRPEAHRRSVGVPSVFISTVLDVRGELAGKRAALAAHESQVAETSWALTMPDDTFAEVYGYEFYVRRGPRGAIDAVAEPIG